MNSTNNFSARESFQIARQMFLRAFADKFSNDQAGMAKLRGWVNSLKFTQTELRLEVELNTNNNIFQFGVTDQQSNSTNVIFNTERRLPLQDSLVVNEMALFVGKPSSQTDTTFDLRTYGNRVDFTAAAAESLDTTFFQHGKFRATVNNDVMIPARGLLNHFYRPQTQQTAALGAGSPGDQFRGAEDGFITVEPNLVLIGSKNNILQIELPSNLATVDANTRAILVLRGCYAQNSTVVS